MKIFRNALVLLCALMPLVSVQSAPSTVNLRLQTVISGLVNPVFVTNAKDGSKRLFVIQKGGIIKVLPSGATALTDFINITSKVTSAGSEQGLLGLTFHPNFAQNGYFFVDYTRASDAATVIARYKTTDSSNTLGDPNSERILLIIPQPFSNHNGGMVEFGPDGNLYIGMGDGGSANDPGNRAQNINELLGKILRISPDVSGVNTNPAYTVPADNPYAGAIPGADEIYTIGMRNPWRFSFDRGGTRQLYAGDVGQDAIEEVDIINRGGNYGWRVYEGNSCTGNDAALCTPANYVAPILTYTHSNGRISITGGYIYRGRKDQFPNGAYFYADYGTGEIFMYNGGQSTMLLDTPGLISSFGEDEDGEIYACTYSSTAGTVQKLVAARANSDFDGDLKTDFGVFRPSNSTWYISNSADSSARTQQFGISGDVITPDDFDGDGKTDIAVFRNGTWYVLRSTNGSVSIFNWGTTGDKPVAGDYDGDGKADFAVFRPSNSIWYVSRSSDNGVITTQWGISTDTPVPANYDGDNKTDFAVFRNGTWYILNSANGAFTGFQWGTTGDKTVPADYDGDGKADIAVFRGGVWYISQSSNSQSRTVQWGNSTDTPAAGDYDGDGKADFAVYRDGNWFVLRATNTVQSFQYGVTGDQPVPTADIP